jgi:putative membrane protein insertion efficiency factor
MRWALLKVIRFYKLAISPLIGSTCRFYPSCSDYAAEALKKHGFVKGVWLAAKRVCKCGPWNPGGPDFVP